MTTNLMSYPFRLDNTGAVVTNEDGTDECYAEELAVLVLTKPGERILVPDFGITDPAFGEFDSQELSDKVSLYGIPVQVVDVSSSYVSDGHESIQVSFDTGTDDADDDYEDDVPDDYFDVSEVYTDGIS